MPKSGPPLAAEEVAAIKGWIAAGATWPEKLVLKDRSLPSADWWSLKPLTQPVPPAIDRAKYQNREPHRRVHPRQAGRERTAAIATSRPPHAHPPALLRSDRPAADARGGRRVRGRRRSARLREARRSPARLAALRRALGAALARRRPLRRHARLRQGQAAAERLAVSRLRHPRASTSDKPYARFVQEQVAGDVLFPGTADGIVALGFIAAGPWDFIGHAELPETQDRRQDRPPPRPRRHGGEHDRTRSAA